MTEPLMTVKGTSGYLDIFENKIQIRREGFIQTIKAGGHDNKEIRISDISGIELSEAYIQFSEQGFKQDSSGLFSGPQDANTLYFKRSQKSEFEEAKNLIQKKQNAENDKGEEDPIDELKKRFARGEISEDEYRNRLEVLQDTSQD